MDLCKNRLAKNSELKTPIAIVSATKLIWEKYRGRFVRGRPNYSLDSGWLLPQEFDLGPWKEFQKSAQEDEFLCLIWSKLLKISDEDISTGLGVTVGTLRYRVGRALRKLGSLTQFVNHKSLGSPNLGVVR